MRIAAVLVACSLAGCAADDGAEIGYGSDFGTPENPTPREDAYAVESRITLTIDPAQMTATIGKLRAFGQSPAQALLAESQLAAPSSYTTLQTALSTTLRDKLAGWMQTELDKVQIAGKSVSQFATEASMIAETVLTQFKIESTLSISPHGSTHAFNSLNFTPASVDIVVPIGGLKADAISGETQVTLGAGGALSIGSQNFGLAFGNEAWQALNLASTRLYGADVRSVLTSSIDCGALATAVAARCVYSSCVGHATELQTMCTSALDAIAAQLRDKIPVLDLDVFRFATGSAHLVDANFDGIGERIDNGMWTVEMDMGQGLHQAPASFTAR